mgnify:CR=1 FL=1
MMFGAGSLDGTWEPLPWSGGDDHYDHDYNDPQAYWGKGNRITRPGNNHAPGRSDPFGHSTTKIPPYWEPSDEKRYPYHVWVRDLDLWCAQTEVAIAQRGPSISSRIGGTAREMIRYSDTAVLRDGQQDRGDGQPETEVEYLLRKMDDRYKKFEIETSTQAVIQLLQFRRHPGEPWDDAFSRFDNCRTRVNERARGFTLPFPVLSWLFLEASPTQRADAHEPQGLLEASGPHLRTPNTRRWFQ